MKKIMMFLVTLLIGVTASAKENNIYYSNYSDWNEFTVNKIDSNDLREVEVERRFKWYQENKKGEFLSYEEGINKYEKLSENNYKYGEYSNWSIVEPENKIGRIVEKEKRYSVKKIKPINKIYIFSGSFNSDSVDLNEIEIYNNGKKINILPTWAGNYIIDSDEGAVELKLDNFYYLDDLSIIIRPINIEDINTLYIIATAPMNNNGEEYIYYHTVYNNNGGNYISLNVTNFSKFNPQYEEEIIYNDLPDVKYSDVIDEVNYYRYKDKLYYFYNIEKKYLDGYYVNKEGYIKDSNEYVDYYRFRNRDKIEISNYIEITDKNKMIDDFIKSTVDYSINGNINYDKNGIYHVEVETYFLKKTIPVLVNIVSNNNDNNESSTNDKLLDDYNKLKDKYDSLLAEKKNSKTNTNDYKVEVIEKENPSCHEKLNEISLENDDNLKKLKLSNQAYDYLKSSLLKIDNNSNFDFGLSWYLWLLFLIILLIIIIIIMLKKRKNKNKF